MDSRIKRFMKISPTTVIIGVLVISAIVLGVLIYRQGSFTFLSKIGSKPTINTTEKKTEATASNSNTRPSQERVQRELPSGLTEDEKKLLNFPLRDDSEEIKGQHFAVAKKLAKKSNVLELNKCEKPSPLVLELTEGQNFTIKNSDSVDHVFQLDRDNVHTIEANSSKEVKAEFAFGPGLYGYVCDDKLGVVGVLLVVAQ